MFELYDDWRCVLELSELLTLIMIRQGKRREYIVYTRLMRTNLSEDKLKARQIVDLERCDQMFGIWRIRPESEVRELERGVRNGQL
jgi:hypothetical protein